MNRKQRKSRRVRADAHQQSRVERAAAYREVEARRERALRRALKRGASTAAAELEAALRRPVLEGRLFTGVPGRRPTTAFTALMRVVASAAPRLLTPDDIVGLYWIATVPWIRKPEEWQPSGKGRRSVFRSLAAHLLARYRTPAFLYNAFFELCAEDLGHVVADVARGGSLYAASKEGRLPIPLTRKMAHVALGASGETGVLAALRWAQVQAHGGDRALLAVWMATESGRRIQSADDERFWETVIIWLSRQAELEKDDIAPLFDYIAHRRREGSFSMKGRSPAALCRGMRDWHEELARVRDGGGRAYVPSGFLPGHFDDSRRHAGGAYLSRVWSVKEILSSDDLASEGRAMRHCVYSYGRLIEARRTSIWSMTLDEAGQSERRLTIEVHNQSRSVMQARRRYNRPAGSAEYSILVRWANQNRLTINL